MSSKITAFKIAWDYSGRCYHVSIPNYDGGNVVTAEHHEAQMKLKDERIKTLEDGYQKMSAEIDQTLGRALGYPRYCDDQKNFPGSIDKDGVCTGDHVPETLAMEAARRIAELEAKQHTWEGMTDAEILDGILTSLANNALDGSVPQWLEGAVENICRAGGISAKETILYAWKGRV